MTLNGLNYVNVPLRICSLIHRIHACKVSIEGCGLECDGDTTSVLLQLLLLFVHFDLYV